MALATLLLVLGFASAPLAQDRDAPRFYLGPRMGVGVPLKDKPASGIDLSTDRVTGLVAGVSLGRYLGVEVAADHWESSLRPDGLHTVGEYGLFFVVPQLRLRYPLLEDRLTPYLVAGVGVSHAEFNDRKSDGVGLRIRASGTGVVGALGGGLEYFVANNISLGVETRWLISRDQEIKVGTQGGTANLDQLQATANLRLLFPEGPDAPRPAQAPAWRPYVGLRAGGAYTIDDSAGGGLELRPENGSIGPFNLLFNVAVGVDLGRYLGLELAAESYEMNLRLSGVGLVREYSVYAFWPQVRLRYPVLDGRLVPYAIAGVGVSYAETNDAKPKGLGVDVNGDDVDVAGVVGGGLDWFLARNIAAGVETKYAIDRGHEIDVQGTRRSVTLDALFVSFGFRIYFR